MCSKPEVNGSQKPSRQPGRAGAPPQEPRAVAQAFLPALLRATGCLQPNGLTLTSPGRSYCEALGGRECRCSPEGAPQDGGAGKPLLSC